MSKINVQNARKLLRKFYDEPGKDVRYFQFSKDEKELLVKLLEKEIRNRESEGSGEIVIDDELQLLKRQLRVLNDGIDKIINRP